MNALGIISRSLRMLGVYANGEAPTGSEAADALSVFNSLIQAYGNESMMVFSESADAIPFIAGQASVTVGPSGSFVTSRPMMVSDSSYAVVGDVSLPLDPLTQWDYSQITLKGIITGRPTSIYVEPGMPNSRIFLFPIPSVALTLQLRSTKRLVTLTSLTDELIFPDGYDRMFAYCLAVDLAPEYEKKVTPEILRGATWAKRVLKRANQQIPRLDMPNGIPSPYDWYAGGGIVGGDGVGGDILVPVP